MLIHSFSKCSAGFTNIVFVAYFARDQIYDITEFTGCVLVSHLVGMTFCEVTFYCIDFLNQWAVSAFA